MTVLNWDIKDGQTVVYACMYPNMYLTMHLLQNKKYFRVEGKLTVYFTHHQSRTLSGYQDSFFIYIKHGIYKTWFLFKAYNKHLSDIILSLVK